MQTAGNRVAALWLAVVGLTLSLSACGGAERLAPQPAGSAAQPPRAEVLYAGRQGLALLSQPVPTARLLARLPLNEKLMRHRVERGFALVTVARTGAEGWVENAKLSRKPATTTAIAPAAAPPVASPTPVSPPATAGDSAAGRKQSPPKPDASIFDAN